MFVDLRDRVLLLEVLLLPPDEELRVQFLFRDVQLVHRVFVDLGTPRLLNLARFVSFFARRGLAL